MLVLGIFVGILSLHFVNFLHRIRMNENAI